MRTYTFDPAADPIAFLYTIYRVDGGGCRLTSWPQQVRDTAGNIYEPAVGLKSFDISERNDGAPASTQLSLSTYAGGAIDPTDLAKGMYAEATVFIYLCNPELNPTATNFHFVGKVGNISRPLHDVVTFELRNHQAMPRFSLVPQFSVMCRFEFGGNFCGMPIMVPLIERTTTYAVGGRGRFLTGSEPAGYGNVYFDVTTGGTTASTAPSFNYTIGATTNDGSVVWIARDAWERACEIASIPDRHTIILTALPDPRASDDAWFRPGKFMPTSGRNKGRVFPIGLWTASALKITTYLPAGMCCDVGDEALIWPDCDKTLTMCAEKYDNARRFGGFPYYAGANAAAQEIGDGM
jgi:hypothetical protein